MNVISFNTVSLRKLIFYLLNLYRLDVMSRM
nr:MAG TPA: hypothetical protein [Caudoviricetes sp.]